MVFSSLLFIFIYLVVTLALYYAVPIRVYRNVIPCVLSLIFYGWGEPSFVLLMIFSIAFNWLAGLLVGKYRNNKKRCKAVLVASVVLNLALIPSWGASGAAAASLITQASTTVILPAIIRPLRPNCRLMLDAVLFRGIFPKKNESTARRNWR